jgi:hypothetical protein
MSQVGSSEVAIFPTFKGFRSATNREVEAAGTESGKKFTASFGSNIAKVGGLIATAFATAKIGDYFTSGVKASAQLEQSVGAVGAIFKDSAGQINAWSASAQTDVGLTKNEFNELGTLIGSQLKNGGTAMDQLAPKTNDLIGLGADLSSMFGGDTKSAVEALSSALKGERDPIEKYGVSLNQAKIDAEAAALGFKKVGGTLSAEANQAATLSLIMKQTADSHGNFAKEADTVAGKQQRLNAMWQNGKTTITQAFLPAVGAITGWLLTKLPGAITVAETAVKKMIGGFVAFGESWRINDGDVTSSGFAGFMERTANFLRPIWGELTGGITAFGAAWRYNDGEVTSSGFPGFMERLANFARDAQEALGGVGEAIGTAFRTGDFSAFSDLFSGFMAIAQPAGPIIAEVGGAIGAMSGEIGGLIAGALPLLSPLLQGAATVMQFLADNTGILTALIVALAAGFVIFKTAQVASNIAALGSVPVAAAQAASNFALAGAIRASTVATAGQTGAQRVNNVTRGAGTVAVLRQTVANVASRVALAAGTVATGVATAAQWAWNAALSANPIALVVLAIAALVAGLVWFFTQTEIGKAAWASFTQFLSEAWANIQLVATTVFTAIGEFFTGFWEGLKTAFATAIQFLLDLFFNFTPLGILVTKWDEITVFFGGAMEKIGTAVSTGIDTVLAFFTNLPASIVATLGDLGDTLAESGKSLMNGFTGGIKDAAGGIGDAVGGALDWAAGFFPNSPAKRGPFSGTGWRKVGTAGAAIFDEFNSGIPSDGFKMAADLTGKVTVGGSGSSSSASAVTAKPPVQITQENHYADGLNEADITRMNAEKMAYALRGI